VSTAAEDDTPDPEDMDADAVAEPAATESDQAMHRAIGAELRRVRDSHGWSRPEFLKKLPRKVPTNTYACWEQGIRQCPIPQLHEICVALEVKTSHVVGLALQRLGIGLELHGAWIDLHTVIADTREEVRDLRTWATKRLKKNGWDVSDHGVVRLKPAVVQEWPFIADFPAENLLGYVRDFTPDSALLLKGALENLFSSAP
jgi:hypothetical protein